MTTRARGTGLGLAIVKKILEDHGGTLTLDDRPEGRGAIATLALPQLRPEAVRPDTTQAETTQARADHHGA